MLTPKSRTSNNWLKKSAYLIGVLSLSALICFPTLAGPRYRNKRNFFIYQPTEFGFGYRPVDNTVGNLLEKDSQYRTFVNNLKRTQLFDELNGSGSYTVFVPTNEAFRSLSREQLGKLIQPENRERVLKRHIVRGEVNGEATEVQTIGGDRLSLVNRADQDGSVTVDNANAERNIEQGTNGVIIEVDRVLLPPDF